MNVFFDVFYSLLLLFSEELTEDRKSCTYKNILVDLNSTIVIKQKPKTVLQDAIDFGCKEYKKRPLFCQNVRSCNSIFRQRRHGFPEVLSSAKQVERLLCIHQSSNHQQKNILKEWNITEQYQKKFLTAYTTCVESKNGTYSILVNFKRSLKNVRVWQCEDIGHVYNDTYEFYNIEQAWMVRLNNETYAVNEKFCDKEVGTCSIKAFHRTFCSVNNVRHCGRITMKSESMKSSYTRLLPGGVAVYGTFQNRVEHLEDGNTNTIKIDWGLYYFTHHEH